MDPPADLYSTHSGVACHPLQPMRNIVFSSDLWILPGNPLIFRDTDHRERPKLFNRKMKSTLEPAEEVWRERHRNLIN